MAPSAVSDDTGRGEWRWDATDGDGGPSSSSETGEGGLAEGQNRGGREGRTGCLGRNQGGKFGILLYFACFIYLD